MVLVVCAGGTICVENPANSLLGMQSRWAWFVNLLNSFGIRVAWIIRCSEIFPKLACAS